MEYSILVDGLWTLDEGRSDFPVAHSADESTDPVPSQVIGQSFSVWRVQDGSSTFREGTWILGVLSMKKWTKRDVGLPTQPTHQGAAWSTLLCESRHLVTERILLSDWCFQALGL